MFIEIKKKTKSYSGEWPPEGVTQNSSWVSRPQEFAQLRGTILLDLILRRYQIGQGVVVVLLHFFKNLRHVSTHFPASLSDESPELMDAEGKMSKVVLWGFVMWRICQ